MRYRIQITIPADRLLAIVEIGYKPPLTFDPELKVYPAESYVAVETRAAPTPTPMPTPRRKHAVGPNSRQVVLERELRAGPKRWGEIKAALLAAGLSGNSINNLISRSQKDGRIQRSPDGLWSLVEPRNAEAS